MEEVVYPAAGAGELAGGVAGGVTRHLSSKENDSAELARAPAGQWGHRGLQGSTHHALLATPRSTTPPHHAPPHHAPSHPLQHPISPSTSTSTCLVVGMAGYEVPRSGLAGMDQLGAALGRAQLPGHRLTMLSMVTMIRA